MNLVPCEACGHPVAYSATSCPKCEARFDNSPLPCDTCGAPVPLNENVCGTCGANLKPLDAMPLAKPVPAPQPVVTYVPVQQTGPNWGGIVASIAALGFIAWLYFSWPFAGRVSMGIEVIDQPAKVGSYIQGKVKNASGVPYNNMFASFKLFDASGNVVGEAHDFLSNLAVGDTWEYKALVIEDRAVRFEVENIGGYPGAL